MDLLRQAGAAEAELILFCIDGDQISAELIEGVHEAFPKAAIFVRAYRSPRADQAQGFAGRLRRPRGAGIGGEDGAHGA